MDAIENAWRDVDAAADGLADASKRLSALASKVTASVKDGSPQALTKAIAAMGVELASVVQRLDEVRAATGGVERELNSGSNALPREVEAALRTLDGNVRVWRNMSEVVAFPVVLSLRPGKVAVDKLTMNSQRPSVIIGAAKDALKNGSSPERFGKSLHAAFVLVNGGRETGRIPLAQIHQVLATNPPGGGSYSAHDFRVDLQWLRASGLDVVGRFRITVEAASAGPTAFPIYEASGDLINAGYVSFSENGSSVD